MHNYTSPDPQALADIREILAAHSPYEGLLLLSVIAHSLMVQIDAQYFEVQTPDGQKMHFVRVLPEQQASRETGEPNPQLH
ncbi:hypothetical protein NOH45_002710 [Salmonella enterica]|nr:hypothetical protein [Salmonella enterica subsp. enterica serovar Ngili]EJM3643779.1 hypothetical protein [Salmonella enterica]